MGTEWEIVSADLPIRQGDLLIRRDHRSGAISGMCVVITADCDINKKKFGSSYACLRIISLHDYLNYVWARKKVDEKFSGETKNITDRFNKWNSDRIGEKSNITESAVREWVSRDDPVVICDSLRLSGKEAKKALLAITEYKEITSVYNKSSTVGCFSCLAKIKSIKDKKNYEDCLCDLKDQAKKEKFPEDVFLLTSLPDVSSGPVLIMLREVVGVEQDLVCTRMTDAYGELHYLRIGRLVATFKYAVSQAFATLYSRIGLPGEYENRCVEAMGAIDEISWRYEC